MSGSRLYGKVLGTVAGCALGDAFGIRTEMMHYKDIEEQYGRITHFDSLPPRRPSERPIAERWHPFGPKPVIQPGHFHPGGRWGHEVGVYTDDTRFRLLELNAIIKKRGPITGADLAAELLGYRLMAEGAADPPQTCSWPAGPEAAVARHIASLDALVSTANNQRPAATGWDAPCGLASAGDPEEAAFYGGPAAVAVASAFEPGATIESVIENVLRYAGGAGRNKTEFCHRVKRALEIASGCGDVFALREPFYKEMLVTFPPYDYMFLLEIIPEVLALCMIAKDDPVMALIGATALGRDADTSAAVACEITGALHGAGVFPKEWVDRVLKCNPEPDMEKVSEEICAIIMERAGMKRKIADGLEALAERS
jgi:hypothetical protein